MDYAYFNDEHLHCQHIFFGTWNRLVKSKEIEPAFEVRGKKLYLTASINDSDACYDEYKNCDMPDIDYSTYCEMYIRNYVGDMIEKIHR